MALSLKKGQKISLAKEAPGLNDVMVGLGWDMRATDGAAFDLDASLFMAGSSGKVRSEADFIFYGQKVSSCGSIQHQGDNRTGEGEGDDEQIKVLLNQVPADVNELVVVVTIHEAEKNGQNFGQVENAFIRLVNNADGSEVLRYDLTEDYSVETALIFGRLYRAGTDWKFDAVGQGYEGGLAALCTRYGIETE